ncbi:MAG: iron-siderophore ABC transporter substrate-binding protein [Nostoc sp.]|uniref:iron-siderophore ABC transporter substrate-binding protein n=1 Tax=Nostoc sp. TaxID=1180 RepID=UPI002FF9BA1B
MRNDKISLRIKMYRVFRLSFISLVTLLLVSSCTYPFRESATPHRSSLEKPISATFRLVKHAMGETLVPVSAQKIVALDPFLAEDALALGVKLLGAPQKNLLELQPCDDQCLNIKDIGWRPTNIERITALKPDLILGSTIDNKETYELLSHIAPTVLYKYSFEEWKDTFIQTANALSKTELAEMVLAKYYARLTQFKAKMGNRLQKTVVSFLSPRPEIMVVFTKKSFSGLILKEAGVARPTSQMSDKEATPGKGGNIAYNLSRELLEDVDGDVLFVSPTSTANTTSQKVLQKLRSEPLWSKLKVVQQGKVYLVRDYWICCGSIAANRVLDDLFKYLLNE